MLFQLLVLSTLVAWMAIEEQLEDMDPALLKSLVFLWKLLLYPGFTTACPRHAFRKAQTLKITLPEKRKKDTPGYI